jgi:hypothetical protein
MNAVILTVAEQLPDFVRLVIERKNYFFDSRAPQNFDLIKQKRAVQNGNDRFRRINRQRAQARAFAARQNQGLHKGNFNTLLTKNSNANNDLSIFSARADSEILFAVNLQIKAYKTC